MSRNVCKHRRAWVICGGMVLWCRECGAFRINSTTDDKIVRATIGGKGWVRPGTQEQSLNDLARHDKNTAAPN